MISAHALLARQFPAIEQSYNPKDAILYALSLGYGSDPVDPQELPFVYEKNLRVVPTMAAVLCSPGFWLSEPSLGANTAMIVHAQHAIEFLQPLAPAASLRGTTSVLEVIDRGVGKGAMVITERLLTDLATEQVVARIVQHTLCRGDGGFSGLEPTPGPPRQRAAAEDTAPDWSVSLTTLPQAALLYRLHADLNPLHVDPEVARLAGFDRPILHGLCTYGMVCRAVVQACLGGDAARMHSLAGQFTAPVVPGDTLQIDIWKGSDQGGRCTLKIRCSVPARQVVAFANGAAVVSL